MKALARGMSREGKEIGDHNVPAVRVALEYCTLLSDGAGAGELLDCSEYLDWHIRRGGDGVDTREVKLRGSGVGDAVTH